MFKHKENKTFTNKDVELVYQGIKSFIPNGHNAEVKLSADCEYFHLTLDGNDICWDSANDDSYTIDGAIGWFQTALIEQAEKFKKA